MTLEITQIPFDTDHYVNTTFPKSMIFLHHTASDGNPFGVVQYWKRNQSKVCTPFLIARGNTDKYKDGQVFQCFTSSKAGWHLGLTAKHLAVGGPGHKTSSFLNFNSVGIEICNWGGLTFKNGKYLTYAGVSIPVDQVQEYPDGFRGYKFYQKYTPAQIASTRELLLLLCDKYKIDKTFKGMEIFNVDKRALCGQSGIWTHCSVRPPSDKQDIHPQPEMVEMLKSL